MEYSISNENPLELKDFSNANFELEKNIISENLILEIKENNEKNNNVEIDNIEINNVNVNKKNVDNTLKLAQELAGDQPLMSNNNLREQEIIINSEIAVPAPTVANEENPVTKDLNNLPNVNRNNNSRNPESNNSKIGKELMSIFPLSIIIILIVFLLLLIYVISFQE